LIGKITIALVAATIAFIIGVRMISQRAPRPDRLGVVSGELLPCPDTPNCVNTFGGAAPLEYAGDRNTAYSTMRTILENWPRTEVVRTDENYIHVEFRSRVFSFIDDGEFYFPPDEGVIHYRSAARTGRSDFGANASRALDIGKKLSETLAEEAK